MDTMTLAPDDALEILDGVSVAVVDVSDHRWYTRQLVVFEWEDEDIDGFFGFYYDRPKTEEQEGMDVFDSDPVKVFPVVAREVVTTVYEAA